jgi:hypothetical protein
MAKLGASLFVLVGTIVIVAVLSSALNEGFKGNPWMIAFAGIFMMSIIAMGLIADRRR